MAKPDVTARIHTLQDDADYLMTYREGMEEASFVKARQDVLDEVSALNLEPNVLKVNTPAAAVGAVPVSFTCFTM